MYIRNTIVEGLNSFRWTSVHMIANTGGRTEPQTATWIVIMLWYGGVLILLIYIHRKILQKQKKIHEHLVFLYDTIRYQVAKAQYGTNTIPEGKGIKIAMEADHKNYPANAATIKQEIVDIQQKIEQEIVSNEQRTIITKQSKNKNTRTILTQLIGRLITIITMGIYKLFW